MDFSLPAELVEFQELIRQLTADQVAPWAGEVDETGEYPQGAFEVFRDVGLLGLCVPAEHGGSGAGMLGLALAVEEVAKASSAAALILDLARASAGPVMSAGTPSQRERWLPGIANGRQRAAIGLWEPEGGADIVAMATHASGGPAEGWVLNGTKSQVVGAAQADWYVVFAKTDEATSRAPGSVTAFVVDSSCEGLTLGGGDDGVGVRGIGSGELVLTDVGVPADCVLGGVGGGLRLALLGLNAAMPLMAARGLGLAEEALMRATERLDGVAAGVAEGARRDIAGLAVDVEAARLLTYRAAWMLDVGQSDRRWAPQLWAARYHSIGVALRAAGLAGRVLGGGDPDVDRCIERWSRDAAQLEAAEPRAPACLDVIGAGVSAHELWWGGLEL